MLFKGVFLFLTRLYGPLCLFGFVLVIGIKILDVGGSVIFAAAESRFPAPVAYVPPAPRAVPPHVPRPAVSTVPSVPKAAVSASVPRQTVPKPPPPRPKNARELRADKFTRHTGVSDPGVLKIYETADRDGNGNLSWGELEDFQKDLMRKVRYKHNTTALRPDEFLKQGGGDCEDWSLFTCGLLRYWGIEAFVGTFTDPKDSSGHAVAMVFSREKIEGKVFYEARNAFTRQNTRIPDGWYAPIDYEFVGALSDAVSPGSVFDGWYVPERIYGLTM
jgi:transglutaminase-like putative cysteine protease